MKCFLFIICLFFLSCSTVKSTSDKGNDNLLKYNTILDVNSGGDYYLDGRLVESRPFPVYSCKEQGRVVVLVKVNKAGSVVEATPGVKGSTTSDECLLSRAKEAALKTKYQSAVNAPERQIGRIIYNFSLR